MTRANNDHKQINSSTHKNVNKIKFIYRNISKRDDRNFFVLSSNKPLDFGLERSQFVFFFFARWTTCALLCCALCWSRNPRDRFPFAHHWPSSISRFYLCLFALNQPAAVSLCLSPSVFFFLCSVFAVALLYRVSNRLDIYEHREEKKKKIPTNVSPECLRYGIFAFSQLHNSFNVRDVSCRQIDWVK